MATAPSGERPGWVRLNVQLRPEQHEWLRRVAYDQRTTIAGLIREFVDEARVRMHPQQELPWDEPSGSTPPQR